MTSSSTLPSTRRAAESSSTGLLIEMPQQRSELEATWEASLTGSPQTSTANQSPPPVSMGKMISMDVLYQARDAGSRGFNRALELLTDAVEFLSEARDAAESGDRIGRAAAVMKFEELLEPLFACRHIGEGFANVVNTIHFAFANLKDEPLTNVQVTTLWRIFREVSSGPFLSFGESLTIVRQLNGVGLSLNNDFITEWISESSTVGEEQSIR